MAKLEGITTEISKMESKEKKGRGKTKNKNRISKSRGAIIKGITYAL